MFIRLGTKQEMFICKDLVENILDYADREMEDKTLEELEKHIKDCPECDAFAKTYIRDVRTYRNTKEEQVCNKPY